MWILYSKIKFEVFYFTQSSIFLEKNKIIGLTLFNIRTKFLTILYFESFSIFFYLLFFPICCTIPNDLKIFKHVANLPWRMNPKKKHQYVHFFYKCDVVKCNWLGYMCLKMFHFLKFGTCARNDNFGAFLVKHSKKSLKNNPYRTRCSNFEQWMNVNISWAHIIFILSSF